MSCALRAALFIAWMAVAVVPYALAVVLASAFVRGDAQRGRPRQLARGVEAGVAEAGNERGIEGFSGGQAHLLGHASGAEDLVEVALDRHRPKAGLTA